MDPSKASGSGEPSREGLPKDEAFKDVTEERPFRTLTKAVPPLRRDPSPLPPQPSVSSGIQAKHPPGIPPIVGHSATSTPAPDCPTPRLRRPHARAEIDAETWSPQITTAWVVFPNEETPVFGWYREGGAPYRDSFFASDGTMRIMTRDTLSRYRLPLSTAINAPCPPGGIMLHPTLHPSIVRILETRDYLRDPRSNSCYPVASEKDWKRISQPGSSLSIDYLFQCSQCGMGRIIRRSQAPIVDNLPASHDFTCEDVGVECSVSMIVPLEFVPKERSPPTAPLVHHTVRVRPEESQLSTSHPPSNELYGDLWRKRMKLWMGIPTYDGSPSLVELRGWKATIVEAYGQVGVPVGRSQVLQAIKYLSGDAEKWWKTVAGQPRGQSLATFEELYRALEQRFIPRSVFEKAIREWNSLKQTGTAEEYMRRVDELATVQPLGETAEYWHAWEGMRPELKAEVQFRLQEQGRQTCSREELWTLLWNAETRYPLRQVRPFPSRKPFKSTPLRAVTSTTPTSVCWICDAQGHRANVCPKRQASGCARCGSKAHDLVACPQRPDLRRTAAAKPNRDGAQPSGRKNKTQQK